MDESLGSRIDHMFARDRIMAWIVVIALWLTIAFVYFAISDVVNDTRIKIALGISALVLLLFNTASIAAMVRHYREDKAHIYGLDIKHLDENRAVTGE